MVTDAELRAALDGHLNSMLDKPPIDWDNVGLTQDGGLYLSQNLLPTETITVGIEVGGSDVLAGIYQITVNAPKGAGKAVYSAEIDRIKAHFVRSSTISAGSGRIAIHKVWSNNAIPDATYYRVPVSIRYRAS